MSVEISSKDQERLTCKTNRLTTECLCSSKNQTIHACHDCLNSVKQSTSEGKGAVYSDESFIPGPVSGAARSYVTLKGVQDAEETLLSEPKKGNEA